MKTYAETKGKKPFDWNKFLDKAERGKCSEDELFEAGNLAGSWVTCACGNLCNKLPRDSQGKPIDKELNKLGSNFFDDIGDIYAHSDNPVLYVKKARYSLEKIEERSAYLLNAQNGGKSQ